MKACLIIIGIWSAVLLFLSLVITGVFGSLYAGSFYPFTLPFIIATGVLVALTVTGVSAKRARARLFWIAVPLHGLLFLPFYYANSRWPGGDDGPGLAWLFFIGGGSYIAGLVALIIAVIAAVISIRKKMETELTTGK